MMRCTARRDDSRRRSFLPPRTLDLCPLPARMLLYASLGYLGLTLAEVSDVLHHRVEAEARQQGEDFAQDFHAVISLTRFSDSSSESGGMRLSVLSAYPVGVTASH